MIAAKQMRECQAPLLVAALQSVVAEIFAISRFDRILTVTATLEEAMALCSPPRSRSTGAPVLAYEDGAPPFDPLDHVARAPVDPAADVADRPVGQLGLALVVGMAERVAYVRVDGCNLVQLALRRRATLNTPADPA